MLNNFISGIPCNLALSILKLLDGSTAKVGSLITKCANHKIFTGDKCNPDGCATIPVISTDETVDSKRLKNMICYEIVGIKAVI